MTKPAGTNTSKDNQASGAPDGVAAEGSAVKAPVETFDPPQGESERRIFQNGDTDRSETRSR